MPGTFRRRSAKSRRDGRTGAHPCPSCFFSRPFRDLWLFGTATLVLKCRAILGSPCGTFPKSLTQFLIALAAKAILRGVARNRESLVFPSSARAASSKEPPVA